MSHLDAFPRLLVGRSTDIGRSAESNAFRGDVKGAIRDFLWALGIAAANRVRTASTERR